MISPKTINNLIRTFFFIVALVKRAHTRVPRFMRRAATFTLFDFDFSLAFLVFQFLTSHIHFRQNFILHKGLPTEIAS